MLDIAIECFRSIVLASLLLWLWQQGGKRIPRTNPGWNAILLGFAFLLFGSVLDITDNFDGLNYLVIIGDTPTQAILEKLVGYLGGFLLLALGLVRWVSSFNQLSDQIEQQKKIEESLLLSSRVFKDTHDGIIICDANKLIIDVNPAFSHITGYSREDVIGKNKSILNSGKQSPDFYHKMWQKITQDAHWKGEVWNRKKNGEIYVELLTISALNDDDNNVINYVGIFSDITHIKAQQEKLNLMAHYDLLTQLPNRALFADRFQHAIAHSKRNGTQLAVCFLDLDNFKPVNDSYGHEVGDQLLIEVSKRISANIRQEDTVSRQGGDEFTLLLNDLDSFSQCEHTLERVHNALSQPYLIDGLSLEISASTGITLYPDDDGDVDTLLRHADQAMYQAKQTGRHRYHLFNAQQDQEAVLKHHRLAEIEQALINNEFQLYYQPKVNMLSGKVFGAEALIRWIHPQKGIIAPLDFLPIIEGCDLEIKIGDWVISQALSQLAQWQQQDINLEISVNIASYHLQSTDFFIQLDNALKKHPSVAPQMLQLEILESSALGDLDAINNIIKSCQDILGINIALDDFGTAYSSLMHLRSLPANIIKLDRSFVREILDDPSDYAIIDGIITLSDSFSRKVIAEGVESTEHGLLLLIMGCSEAQGYAIAKPMPAHQVSQWIADYKPNQSWLKSQHKYRSDKENKVDIFRLVASQWKNKFIAYIQSSPDSFTPWPMMNNELNHCGVWINRAKQEQLFESKGLTLLDQSREEMQLIAHNLLQYYQNSELSNARAGLTEFQIAFDEMYYAVGQCE